MNDREPRVIRTREGGTGWTVAIVLLVLIIAGGFILYESGYLGSRHVEINVSLPKVEAPAPVTR